MSMINNEELLKIRSKIKDDLMGFFEGKKTSTESISANIKDKNNTFYNKKTVMLIAKEIDSDFIKSINPKADSKDFNSFSNIVQKAFFDKDYDLNLIQDFNKARNDLERLKVNPNYLNHVIRNFNKNENTYGDFYKELAVIDALRDNNLTVSVSQDATLKDKINTFKKYFKSKLTGHFITSDYYEKEIGEAIKNFNSGNNETLKHTSKYSRKDENAYYLKSLKEELNEKQFTENTSLGRAERLAFSDYYKFKDGDISLKEMFQKRMNYDFEIGQEFIYYNTLKKIAENDSLQSILNNYQSNISYNDPYNSTATIKSFDLNKLIGPDTKLNPDEMAELKNRLPNRQLLRVLKQIDNKFLYSEESYKNKNKKLIDFIDRRIPKSEQNYNDIEKVLVEFAQEYNHKLSPRPTIIDIDIHESINNISSPKYMMTDIFKDMKNKDINNPKYEVYDEFGKKVDLQNLKQEDIDELEAKKVKRINNQMNNGELSLNKYEKLINDTISPNYLEKITNNGDDLKNIHLYVSINKNKKEYDNDIIKLYNNFASNRINSGITENIQWKGLELTNKEFNDVITACYFYQYYDEYDNSVGFEPSSKNIKTEAQIGLFKEIMNKSPKVIKNFSKDLEIVKLINSDFDKRDMYSPLNKCSNEVYTRKTFDVLVENGYQFSKEEMRTLSKDRKGLYENYLMSQTINLAQNKKRENVFYETIKYIKSIKDNIKQSINNALDKLPPALPMVDEDDIIPQNRKRNKMSFR